MIDNQYNRMFATARYEIPSGKYAVERSLVLTWALNIARENRGLSKRDLKRKIRREVRSKLKEQKYGFITWQMLLWFLLPKLIDWFIVWWFSNSEYEIGLEP